MHWLIPWIVLRNLLLVHLLLLFHHYLLLLLKRQVLIHIHLHRMSHLLRKLRYKLLLSLTWHLTLKGHLLHLLLLHHHSVLSKLHLLLHEHALLLLPIGNLVLFIYELKQFFFGHWQNLIKSSKHKSLEILVWDAKYGRSMRLSVSIKNSITNFWLRNRRHVLLHS